MDLARALVERDILGPAEAAIDRDFRDQPTLAADLREATGSVHDALGMYAKAAELFAGESRAPKPPAASAAP